MTLLKGIYDLVKAHNQERPPQVGVGAAGFSNIAGGPAGGGNLIQQMSTYAEVSWVFAAVSKIAEAVASSDWHLYRGPGRTQEVFNHPALTLWESANEFDTRQDFLEMTQQHFELTGEMWWVLVRNAQRVPVEMWAVRPDRMRPVKDHDEYIKGYIYQLGAEKIPLDLEDVIFTRHPNPLDPYRGMGPIQALMLDLGSEVEAASFNRAFFRNDATPGGIITTERTMSDSDFKKLVDRWKIFHQGTNNAGRMGFLERATFQERKFTQRDMQFVQLRQQTRDLVLAAYGVPLPILGVMEAPSRANAEAAEFIFARLTVRPRLNRIKLSLNHKLLPLYPNSAGLHFEFDDPTPNNRELDLREATEGYNAGIHLLNEARALLELDELPEGDVVKPSGGGGLGDPFALGASPKKKGVHQLNQGVITKSPDPLDMAERLMRLAWTRRLKAEATALNAYLDEILGRRLEPISVLRAAFDNSIDKIELTDIQGYDWDWWTKYSDEVIEELTAALRATMINEWPQIEPLLADEFAARYAETRGTRLLRVDGDLNIVNTTRARVNQLVAQTIERGDSLQTLQKALREDFAFSPEKAITVARTETATAQGQGAQQAAIAQNFDQKRWITQGDDLVDANGNSTPCLDAEAQGWIKIGDPFISGFDTIPAHPRCRCNVRYRLDPDDEERSLERRDWQIRNSDGTITYYTEWPYQEFGAGPRCSKCLRMDKLTPNRDGAGFWCRRCSQVVE